MELGKIAPRRVELRKGALYKNGNKFFEIMSVDTASKTFKAKSIYQNVFSQEIQYTLQDFSSLIKDLDMVYVGNVEYQKRFLRKPKRIVHYFQ